MKKLSIEDKAKAYDKAIERANELIYVSDKDSLQRKTVEHIFPELKESDEKIRKALIHYMKDYSDGTGLIHAAYGVRRNDAIAWLEKVGKIVDYYEDKLDKCACDYFNKDYKKALEKQGEQEETLCDKCKKEQPSHSCQDITALGRCALEKPVDKVEPKFHEGEWVTDDGETVFHITIDNNKYQLETLEGTSCHYSYEIIERKFRLWTIQDAKDGDVLAVDNIIFIYKRILANHIVSYCKLINDVFDSSLDARTCCEGNTYVHPATKEQRDTLMKAMADARYTFDFEKKELKKIEQKPAWSKEDEKMIDNIIFELEENQENISGVGYKIDWLKSLKDRVQPQPKWSEEDKQYLLVCKNALYKYQSSNHWDASIIIRWLENKLKSFRPQNYWKPSDEQITWLYRATDEAKKDSRMKQVLNELLSDLKKLREE